MSWAIEVDDLLKKGLYVNNLNEIARVCLKGIEARDCSMAAFIVQHIVQDLADLWDGPVTVEYHQRAEQALRPVLQSVIDTVVSNGSSSEIVSALNAAIEAYHKVPRPDF